MKVLIVHLSCETKHPFVINYEKLRKMVKKQKVEGNTASVAKPPVLAHSEASRDFIASVARA